ncbi:MAG: choice-of-anchor H family protein [Woeseiaceae bacterium]|nr:choice-of-anchor H family protein [Woeseiaceae bacterium]
MSTIVFVCLMALTVSGVGLAEATDEERVSVSRHIVQGGRTNEASARESTESHDSLVTSGIRLEKGTRSTSGKTGSTTTSAEAVNYDFWIFDADVVLFNDEDGDGFFHGIDLLIDADTIYSAAEVYAVVYLSLDFGPWNEYGATEDFWIFGASGEDEYVLVTELVSGYPTGDYDLLIELFDAVDHSLLATLGPEDASQLAVLPLEDQNRDARFVERPVTVSRGGGGAADAWTIGLLLLLLVFSAARKIWRHRNDRLVRIDSPSSWSQFQLHTRQPFPD